MTKPIISGVQQMGVGIPNVYEAWKWYRTYFGVNIPVLDSAGEAGLMLPYTGGKPHQRHAVLAINIQGGGGMEIWQYTSREPQLPTFDIQLGDLGIYAAKVKSKDVGATYEYFKNENLDVISGLMKSPDGRTHFFVKDPWGNIFQIVSSDTYFHKTSHGTGGIYGGILGVTDMNRACEFYKNILGYDVKAYDEETSFADFANLPGGKNTFQRVLLHHSQARTGAFSQLLGPSEIELVSVKDREPRKIFENRFWGDRGFIHLSFDIRGMKAMEELCKSHGHPFTIDSADSFDMGEAAGHFTYIEDPDGALIEFVETHKVPIMKKLGWFLDLRKRDPQKSLPRWMLRAMSFGAVK
ncbi:VOC family protein [Saprospiraceae bacterium]|jgi:catechol 2,3-dioxygenase-like lactoylglutathione lyase family enzyme|nr:VOC family protein [Bacteroidota bacterium]MDB4727968.1 VOC family protein [Saprospiraceae bacterium]